MRRPSGNDLLIAKSRQGDPLILTREQRSRHLYVTGSTGSGKSKFLEYLIRQDIVNWRESECGLLLLDPHGSIYDGLMHWLPRTSSISVRERPIIPIDLRRDDWVVAYNLLREREQVAASVVTDNLVNALAYVWGAGGTDATPRLARNMATVFQVLYEHKLTLVEALKVLDFASHEFRATLARGTKDEATRVTLERLNALKPFYLYIDEFQHFVSPTIAENLDEARGFGLHLTLAHQYPSQLIEASREYGQRLYESIMENARSKISFSLSLRDRNLATLADWLYSGTFDPFRVKHELYSHKVMDYREETREITTRGTSRGTAQSEAQGAAAGTGTGHSETLVGGYDGVLLLNPMQRMSNTSQFATSSDTTTRGNAESESESESTSEVPVFIPVFGEELSNVQYVPLDEQRFLAEQKIMFQPDRHATARFLGMTAPAELRTQEVQQRFGDKERAENYRLEQLAKFPFVLSSDDAHARLQKRHVTLALSSTAPETEPRNYKRRVPSRAKIKPHVGGTDDSKDGARGG